MKQPVEELAFPPDAIGHGLDELASFVMRTATAG
jgi:hypothetical protein